MTKTNQQKVKDFLINNGVIIVMFILVIYTGFTSDNFFTKNNFMNILMNMSSRLVIALGIAGCVITAGCDLSAGRMIGFGACISGMLLQRMDYSGKFFPDMQPLNVFVVALIAMLVCAAFGTVTGFFIAYLNVPPFIATLAMMEIVYGIGLIVTNATPLGGYVEQYTNVSNGKFLGINYLIWIAIIVAAITWFIFNMTRLFKERYKEKEDPWIKLWKQDLEAGTILQSCPGAVCARYEQAVSGLLYDASCDMFYVMIDGKPLYYPQEFSDEQVLERYRKLCEEQDRESAHCYRNGNLQIPDGAVIMDAGAAEGYFALTVIEHAGRVYLTDRDERWNAAWQKTFAPYRDKVVFLHGVLGGSEAGCDVMTIDDIIGTGRLDFLKVDVGGAEQEVLLGAQKVLGNAAAMRCVVAAYHTHESEAQIEHILRENGFQTDRADGYFLHMDYEKPVWENELRHALVWAERN